MTIRKKIISTYILMILIPLALFIFMYKTIENDYTNRVTEYEKRENKKYETYSSGIIQAISFALLNDENLTHPLTIKYLDELFNEIPFDARISSDEIQYESNKFQESNSDIYIIEVNQTQYTVELSRYSPLIAFRREFSQNLIIMITIFALFYIIIHIFFIRYISRIVISPLGNLKTFANAIKSGNYDYSMKYNKSDEIGEVYNAFEKMRKRLKTSEEKNKEYKYNRKKLIANISHDLKTPMTAIKGYIEGIIDGVADTPEKIDKYIRIINGYIKDMDQLINDLFLFSKLDIDKIQFNFKQTDIKSYFNDCVEELSYDLEEQGIALIYNFNYSKDKSIAIDALQLKRVINNIIFNAIKYLNKDEKKIILSIDDHPDGCKISITDNGQGIPKENIEKIFNDFFKVDQARNFEGSTGLGLSIAKKIIASHGGKISASSQLGEGTTIQFTLKFWEEFYEENFNNRR